jgi:rod shape-determining protein MreD
VRDVFHGGLTLAAAFLVHAVLGRFLAVSPLGVDFFLIAVLLFAIIKGDLAGAVMGAVAGLFADAFSIGVFGVSGAAYIVAGFLSGWVSRRINVLGFLRSFIFLTGLAAVALAGRLILAAAVVGEPIPWQRGLLLVRPVATALAGALAFAVFQRFRRRTRVR